MSTVLNDEHFVISNASYITQDIESHPAWHGRMSGLSAEKLLRGKKIPFLFILRAGECEGDYYVTFVLPDLSIKHQPFVISMANEGWYFENGGGGGPFTTAIIDDVIHLIMHCGKQACTPKINKK